MIKSKVDLKWYISQDRKLNGFAANRTFFDILKEFIYPNSITVLRYMRKLEYYTNVKAFGASFFKKYYYFKYRKASRELGYSIAINTCGPGLSLPHYGTIIISGHAKIGCNCRIHACVNIGASAGKEIAPTIGDNVYIGPSCVLYGDIVIGNNNTIGANATVNKSYTEEHVVIAGSPAIVVKRDYPNWLEFNKI